MIPKIGAFPIPGLSPTPAPDPRAAEPTPPPRTPPPAPSNARLASSPEAQAQRADFLSTPPQNFDDQYWAAQPPAVQALRNIDDLDERQRLAGSLMAAGYKIDVPIMVWGWGAQNTTNLRQAYGYTWVPHAMQEAIKIAPGLSMPGVDAYDPNNPPPDSILVPNPRPTPNGFVPGPPSAEVESADGKKFSLPDQLLSTSEQALAVQRRLAELGFKDLPLAEQPPAKPSKIHWREEPRRTYSVGGLNVGLLMDSLARNIHEDELRALLKKAILNVE